VKTLNPVSGWKGSLEHQGAYDIDGGTNHALGLAVLRESVGTRHLKLDAVRESAGGTIIALDAPDGATKLRERKAKKWERVGRCRTSGAAERSTSSGCNH
jgi:hypothetical protein